MPGAVRQKVDNIEGKNFAHIAPAEAAAGCGGAEVQAVLRSGLAAQAVTPSGSRAMCHADEVKSAATEDHRNPARRGSESGGKSPKPRTLPADEAHKD